MRQLGRVVVVAGLAACGSFERQHFASLPAAGVTAMFGDVERGAVGYVGAPDAEAFELGVREWTRAGGENGADRKLGRSEWGVEIRGELLDLWGRSPERSAGVDFALYGPDAMDVELVALEGRAEVHEIRGDALVTARSVLARATRGSLDLAATEGDLEVLAYPRPEAELKLRATDGDVTVLLPYGTPISLTVDADPRFEVVVGDLGFSDLDAGPDRVVGTVGAGTVDVSVVVVGGAFRLAVAPEPDPDVP